MRAKFASKTRVHALLDAAIAITGRRALMRREPLVVRYTVCRLFAIRPLSAGRRGRGGR
jgi:hypothetical protein